MEYQFNEEEQLTNRYVRHDFVTSVTILLCSPQIINALFHFKFSFLVVHIVAICKLVIVHEHLNLVDLTYTELI